MSVVTVLPTLLSISEPRESEIAISTYEQTYRNFTTNTNLRAKAAIAMHVCVGGVGESRKDVHLRLVLQISHKHVPSSGGSRFVVGVFLIAVGGRCRVLSTDLNVVLVLVLIDLQTFFRDLIFSCFDQLLQLFLVLYQLRQHYFHRLIAENTTDQSEALPARFYCLQRIDHGPAMGEIRYFVETSQKWNQNTMNQFAIEVMPQKKNQFPPTNPNSRRVKPTETENFPQDLLVLFEVHLQRVEIVDQIPLLISQLLKFGIDFLLRFFVLWFSASAAATAGRHLLCCGHCLAGLVLFRWRSQFGGARKITAHTLRC